MVKYPRSRSHGQIMTDRCQRKSGVSLNLAASRDIPDAPGSRNWFDVNRSSS